MTDWKSLNRRNFLALAATAPVVTSGVAREPLDVIAEDVFGTMRTEAVTMGIPVGRTELGELVTMDQVTGEISHPGVLVYIYGQPYAFAPSQSGHSASIVRGAFTFS